MALIRNFTIPNTSIEVSNAYHKIYSIHRVLDNYIKIEVISYKDIQDRNEDKDIPGSRRSYTSDVNQSSWLSFFNEDEVKKNGNTDFKNSYKFLKTLDDFSNAKDA